MALGQRARYRVGPAPLPWALPSNSTHHDQTWRAFSLNRKPRVLADGNPEDYWACDALQAHVSGLYRAAGLAECSSHSGRRTFATRLLAKGHCAETIQKLLGHAHLDHTDAYLDVDGAVLELVFAGVL